MPPVMITWVTPTAMMPITDTCRIMTVRRCGLNRKLWPTKIQPRSSKASAIPTRTSRMLTSGGQRRRLCRQCRLAALVAVLRCHDRRLPDAAATWRASSMILTWSASERSRNAGDLALVHDHDPVAHAQHLRHLGRDHQHGDALAGQLGDQPMDLGLGADVDAARRLVQDQDAAAWSAASGRSAPSAGCRRTGS